MKEFSIILSLVFVFYALGSLWVVSSFEDIFRGFGTDLPYPTQFILDTYRYWLVLAIVPLAAYMILKDQKKALSIALYSLLAFAIIFIPIVITLMYLPIFKLGAVVS